MTQRLARAESGHGAEGGIDVFDDTVGVGDTDRVGGLFQRLR